MTRGRTILLMTAVAVMAATHATAQRADTSDDDHQPSFLFVQSSKSIEVTNDTITLVDAPHKTTVVAARPESGSPTITVIGTATNRVITTIPVGQ